MSFKEYLQELTKSDPIHDQIVKIIKNEATEADDGYYELSPESVEDVASIIIDEVINKRR